ncbi:hypothetical protein NW757_001874 [Fusarium falciforme]|nr:hypothetical protein NW757_001874 [Fusarium falciforme]
MSLRDYQAALPDLFGAPKTTQPSHPQTTQPVLEEAVATTKPKPPETAQIKSFVDIIEYHTEDHDVEIVPTKKFLPSKRKTTKKQQTYKDYAVVLRRTWMQKNKVPIQIRIELEIQSQALCQILRKIVVDSYEDTDLQSFPIKFRSPFSELFFYRDEIKALKEDENNSIEVRQGAEVLHDFIAKNGLMTSIIADHERYSKEGHVVGDILWTIYPPNSLVVLNVGKLQECWICRNVSSNQGGDGYLWEVAGFRIGYDGASPGLTRQSFQLPVMGMQVCKISDLPLVPVKDYKDWPLLQKSLHARAARLQKVLGDDLSSFSPQTYANAGWERELRSYFSSMNPMLQADQLDDRVVVDYKSFLSEHRRGAASLVDFRRKPKQTKSKARARGVLANAEHEARFRSHHRRRHHPRPDSDSSESDSDSDSIEFDSEDNADMMEPRAAGETQEEPDDVPQPNLNTLAGLSEAIEETFHISGTDFNLLFPALVPAFGLKKKEWLWVLSDELQGVAWNMVAFEFLQLEAATKHLVQALVKGHKANSTAFDDVVSGKGQGLVFLLHGKPGLGKTLTAGRRFSSDRG